MKEETRKMKKIEQAFKASLKAANVDTSTVWDDVRDSIKDDPSFQSITVEAERIRIFKVI